MIDKIHNGEEKSQGMTEEIAFSAQSMEDVAFRFSSFTEEQKRNACICFDIRIEGLLDTESIVESSRWLCSHSAVFVPSLPLEPSALFLVDKMKPRAISLHLLYDVLDDNEVKFGIVKLIVERLKTPLWIVKKGLTKEQLAKIEKLPVERFWAGV